MSGSDAAQLALTLEHCPTCGQPDNCGDCNHYGTLHYVAPAQEQPCIGTCGRCGTYWDMRYYETCPPPCGGFVG